MWRLFWSVSVFIAEAAKILEYRAGVNYGQVFRDYTNNGWHAVSGSSSAAGETNEIIPTDRGAYIDGTASGIITLPSNDVCTSSFSLSSSFMIAIWLLVDTDQDGVIFARYKTANSGAYYFYLRRYKTNDILAFEFCVAGVSTGVISGPTSSFIKGKEYLDKWCFIALDVSSTSIKSYQNGVIQKSITISTPYQETGDYTMVIGGKFRVGIGSKLFMWSFAIDENKDQTLYMSNTATSNCLVSPCDKCDPEIISDSSQGCLSKEKNEYKNSNKDDCPKIGTGCISPTISLICGCTHQSCTYSGSKHLCVCPSAATASTTTCTCPAGQTIRWDLCCESSCLTCSRTSFDTCLTCFNPNAIPDTTGCKCKDGFYGTKPLITTTSCLACHPNCNTCTSALLCTKCNDVNADIHATVGCTCKVGFYNTTNLNINGNCKVCHPNCKTCVASLLCTSCLDLNAQIHTTVGCICKDGFYNTTALNSNGQCKNCHPDCKTCTSSLACTSCKDDNAQKHPTVGCTCNTGFYNLTSLSANGNCLACHSNCKTCTSSLLCNSCKDSNSQIHATVGCTCKVGYYNLTSLNSDSNCKICYSDCTSCTSSLLCTNCKDANAEIHATVGCICKNGYYNTSSLNINGNCKTCHSDCKTCTSSLLCTSCIDSNAQLHGIVGCYCKAGYYNLTSLSADGSCKACHSHCSTCSTSNSCLTCKSFNAIPSSLGCTCKDGYYNAANDMTNQNACMACYQECKTCSESTKCLTCVAKFAKLDFNSNCECLSGYRKYGVLLDDVNSCYVCEPDCLTCSRAFICDTCKASNSKASQTIGCECLDTFYKIKDMSNTDACAACHIHCKICQMAEVCTSCLDANANPTTAGCLCKIGYYMAGSPSSAINCQACLSECASCIDGSSCSSCVALNTVLSGGICKCKDGFWSNTVLTSSDSCKSCYVECKTCSGLSNCDLCISSNSNVYGSGCKCNDKFYSIGLLVTVSSCLPCNLECSKCTSENLCTECLSVNSHPSINKGCDCNLGFYKDPVKSDYCQPCDSQCKTCSTFLTCLTCVTLNSYPSDSGCLCKDGYFNTDPLTTPDACKACHADCSKCNDPLICLACKDSKGIPNRNEGCFCKIGEYLDDDKFCKQCNQNCITCSNATSCDTCKNPLTIPAEKNYCKCIDGYYITGLNPTECNECPDFCITCPNGSMCEICKLKNSNPLSTGSCICPEHAKELNSECICPKGQAIGIYNEKFECMDCHFSCSICRDTSKFGCISCSQYLEINKTDNTCSICPRGYYYNGTFCNECYGKCETCSNQTFCLSCTDKDFSPEGTSGICKKVCPQGQVNVNNICKRCPKLCKICDKQNDCSECVENSTKNQSECRCNLGFKDFNNSCIKQYFKGTLSISKENQLKLEFLEKTEVRLKKEDFLVLIPDIKFSYSLINEGNQVYKFIIKYKEKVHEDTIASITVLNKTLRSHQGYFLNTFGFSGKLNKQKKPNQALEKMKALTKAGKAAIVATTIAIAIVSNPAAAWAMLNTIQLITLMPLNSNPFTEVIHEFCGALGGFSFVPSPMPFIFDENSSDPPYKEASEYGYVTSVFWINIGPSVTFFLVLIVLWPIFLILSKFKLGRITVKLLKVLANYKYSVFLRFWTQAFLDIGVFGLIQMKSVIII